MTNRIARLVGQPSARAWDRLALLVSLLLVVLLAHALAQLTWTLLPPPSQALPPAATASAQPRTDYRQIAALHLFGQAAQTTAARTTAPIDAPETRLNLTLRGILFNTTPGLTRAIISAPGREDEVYQTGAQLPGGVVIDQIYSDRVMLLRNGQYETLRLPEESLAAAAPAPAARGRPARGRPPAAAASDGLATIRQDIVANPQNVANYIQGEPVNRAGGGVAGFRVFAGQNRAVFDQSELREGDIVTNVNGIQLDGLDKVAEAMTQLTSSDAVTVTVLRDGAEHTLQIQLQN